MKIRNIVPYFELIYCHLSRALHKVCAIWEGPHVKLTTTFRNVDISKKYAVGEKDHILKALYMIVILF